MPIKVQSSTFFRNLGLFLNTFGQGVASTSLVWGMPHPFKTQVVAGTPIYTSLPPGSYTTVTAYHLKADGNGV